MQSSDYPDNLLLSKVPQALRDVADWLTTQKAVGNDAVLTITNGDGTTTKITINNVAHATAADKSTGDKNGVDITNYLRGDVSITPSQKQDIAASGTPATLFAILLSKIKAMQGTTNFQDAVPATLSALAGYFDSSGNALTAVKGKSTPAAGDNSTLLATTAFVASALSSAGYISTPIDSYDVSNASAWWIKLKGAPGIIIQGGIISSHSSINLSTITFPIAYPSAILIAGGFSNNGSTEANRNSGSATNLTLTGCQIVFDPNGRWFSIGY
jgi:hypothetical protein